MRGSRGPFAFRVLLGYWGLSFGFISGFESGLLKGSVAGFVRSGFDSANANGLMVWFGWGEVPRADRGDVWRSRLEG